jgi:hypothetical protein
MFGLVHCKLGISGTIVSALCVLPVISLYVWELMKHCDPGYGRYNPSIKKRCFTGIQVLLAVKL